MNDRGAQMNAMDEIRVHAHAIVDILERAAVAALAPAPIGGENRPTDRLTVRALQELVEHEAIVQEAYLDSKGILTWGIGVTNKSGHRVERYRDNPQSIERCIEIFVWLLRTEYVPDVEAEFAGHELTEAQFAAALSFHWNTGAIGQASWCDAWKAGDIADARRRFMQWRKPAEIIPRREKEAALFFDGKWSQDGLADVIPVRKPSYLPDFRNARQVDIRADLERALA